MLHEQLRDRFRLENIVGAHGSMQDVFRDRPQGGGLRLHRPHLRRERDGQGAGRAGAPPRERPRAERPFSPSTAPRCPRAPRERAVRPREGRVHRRDGAQDRPLRAGARRRRCSSTRSARPQARPAGEAAARPAGARVPARGRHRARHGRRPHRRRHQPATSRRDGARRALPRGPLLPAERDPHRAARRCASGRRTSRCSSSTSSRSTRAQRPPARRHATTRSSC